MKEERKVVIVDYGVGNLFSVYKAFKKFNDNVSITTNKQEISDADHLVLPGVGSFKNGMQGLEELDLVDTVRMFASSGKPVLGICLGAQLLLSQGEEFGQHEGLDIVSGCVKKLDSPHAKIPHVGWNTISPANSEVWKSDILDNINSGEYFYFVHSYACNPTELENVIAVTQYEDVSFCAMYERENVVGVQFHPEKSGPAGLRIIANFLNRTL